MAHCPFERLSDITQILDLIRELPAVKESKPGIFYIGSQSFLHFHLKENRRWADVRDGSTWGSMIDLPFSPTKTQKAEFMKEIFRRHLNVVELKKSKRAKASKS